MSAGSLVFLGRSHREPGRLGGYSERAVPPSQCSLFFSVSRSLSVPLSLHTRGDLLWVTAEGLAILPTLLNQGSVNFIIEFFSNDRNVTAPCASCGDSDKHTGKGTEMYETKINVYYIHHKGVIMATLAVAAISRLQCASYFVKHIPRINPLILIMTQRRFQFY